jgi:DNA-directed RNA polymerase specialized sigma24 family protein
MANNDPATVLYPEIDALSEPIPEITYALARLRPLLPPQISEEEVVSHLMLRLSATVASQEKGLEGWLYDEGANYVAARNCMRTAAEWLGLEAEVAALKRDALKEASTALALFGDRLTPDDEEARTLLCHAMTRLGTYERLTAALYFLEGRSLPQIGMALDLPPDEVSACFRRALREVLATAPAEAWRWNPALSERGVRSR